MKQLNKLAVRILSIVSVIVIIALNVIFVSATPNESFPSSQIQPQNWTEEDRVGTVVDGYEWYNIEPWQQGYYIRIRERNLYQDTSTYQSDRGLTTFTYQVGPMHIPSQGDQYYWRYDFDFQYFYNGRFLDLGGLNNDCKFYFEFNLEWLVATGTVISYNQPSFNIDPTINYYDSTGKYLSSQSVSGGYHWNPDSFYYQCVIQGNFIIPETARYCTVSFDLYNFGITANEFCTFSFNCSNVQFMIGKPERLIVQNYQNVGTLVSTSKYTNNWRIDNSANIGSAYMTSNDPFVPSKGGLLFNTLNYIARPTSTYQYSMRFRMFYPNRFLTLDNLPKGTTTGVVAKFHIYSSATWYYPNAQIMINYFDADFQQISDAAQHVYFERNYERIDDNTGGSLSANIVLDYPDNAKYLTVNIYLNNFYIFGSTDEEVTCICDQFEFWVGEKIEAPGFPSGDQLGDLSNSLDVEKPSIDHWLNEWNNSIDKNVFSRIKSFFQIFWSYELLKTFAFMSLTMGLLSTVIFGGR